MTDRMWGHDAVSINIPMAVAKIIADREHPHRLEVLNALSEALELMLEPPSVFELSPMAMTVNGILQDGADMSVGPVAYMHKAFYGEIEAEHARLQSLINKTHTMTTAQVWDEVTGSRVDPRKRKID